jgi:hypothetical protein
LFFPFSERGILTSQEKQLSDVPAKYKQWIETQQEKMELNAGETGI